MLSISFTLTLLFSSPASAWEVDNITCRFRDLKDSLPALNHETNSRFQKVLRGESVTDNPPIPPNSPGSLPFNEGNNNPTPIGISTIHPPTIQNDERPIEGCSRSILNKLRGAIASDWMGNLETFAEGSANIDKCKSKPPPPHVYSETSSWDLGVASLTGLGSSIKMGGYHVGVDKLSHFMTEGYNYYRIFDDLKRDRNVDLDKLSAVELREVLAEGNEQETGRYGLATTGIFSYGDVMANFQGFRFWRQVLDGPNPYFKCEGGKWVQKRQFDWNEYLNHGFDEGLNCNRYHHTRMQTAVDSAIGKVTEKHAYSRARSCPLDPSRCADLVQKFQPQSVVQSLLHPNCFNPQASSRPAGHSPPQWRDPSILDVPLPIQQSPETTR